TRRQVHTGVVQQAASSSYWAVAHEGLIEPEVVERAFVAGLLAAVVVRGVGDQLRGAEIPLDPERGQVELVRGAPPRRIGIYEAPAAGVQIQGPVVGNVVLLLVLIVDPGGDGPLLIRDPRARQPQQPGVVVVRLLLHRLQRDRIDAIDPAAIVAVRHREARAEGALHQGPADRRPRLIARIAVLSRGKLATAVDAGFRQARLGGDVAYRAALGPGAEQRALRAAQHFHPLDVEGLGQRLVRVEGQRAHLDRRVIEIDAGGAGAAGSGDAADGDVVGAGVVEVHSGSE